MEVRAHCHGQTKLGTQVNLTVWLFKVNTTLLWSCVSGMTGLSPLCVMCPVLLPPSDLSPRTDLLTVWTGGLFGSSATVAGDYTTYRGVLVMPRIPYDSVAEASLSNVWWMQPSDSNHVCCQMSADSLSCVCVYQSVSSQIWSALKAV